MPCPVSRCKFKFPAPLLLLSPSLSEPQAESCSVLCQYRARQSVPLGGSRLALPLSA